jgi:aminomethyltransferase
MVPFAGWEMPVYFRSTKSEHLAVRRAVGLFDVSHMGEIELRGRDALANVQKLVSNNAARLGIGQAMYTGLLTHRGTFVDDVLVYRLGEDRFMFCVNAANTEKDFAWIQGERFGELEIENLSDGISQIAIQGPRSAEVLGRLADLDPLGLRYYWSAYGEVCGKRMLVSRTGYTGELGFELYMDWDLAPEIWGALLEAGSSLGIQPAGLAARDTLRLEAGVPLYGNDIDEETTPYEAGLGWTVKLKKGPFNGSEALLAQRREGVKRRLVGFAVRDRRVPRKGQRLMAGGSEVGVVTSGAPGFAIEKTIGMGYVDVAHRAAGTELEVEMRGRRVPAVVVALPFYSRTRSS